ncbi:MAG: RidA family protein [Bacteroidota bacterium]
MSMVDKKLAELGIELPKKPLTGKGVVPARREGNLVFLSGHGCEKEDGQYIHTGKLGAGLTIEQGYEAARQCGLQLLASLKNYLGDLDRVTRIIKVTGFVNSAPDFYKQPAVMHGCSDLLVDLFGERGQHARSAIGVAALPNNMAVEVEMIVAVKDE